jgi:hypothetical protein
MNLHLRKKLMRFYIWSIALYGAETWTLWKIDQKYLGIFGMWCWRRMEKISRIDCVKNEDVIQSQGGKKHTTYKEKKGRLTGLVTSCVGTAFKKHY